MRSAHAASPASAGPAPDAAAARTRVRIGTQGWNYDAWVGPFYPSGTRVGDFLSMYARAFRTVEVDSTFYAIPPAKTVRGWAERTPADFQFALKLPQEITHERRLRGAADLVATFYDRARELEGRLGPILVQLGPDFGPSSRARSKKRSIAATASSPRSRRSCVISCGSLSANEKPAGVRSAQPRTVLAGGIA